MTKLKFSIFALLILKILSAYFLNLHRSNQTEVAAFVNYKCSEIERQYTSHPGNLAYYISFDKGMSKDAGALMYDLLKIKDSSIKDHLALFNNSPLQSKLNYDAISYEKNVGLTKSQNITMLKHYAFSKLRAVVDSIKISEIDERPYLLRLTKYQDSMDVYIIHGKTGGLNGLEFMYDGKKQEVNSLPINIGKLEKPIKLCYENSVTKEKRCFNKDY